jgi:hypothetical protein
MSEMMSGHESLATKHAKPRSALPQLRALLHVLVLDVSVFLNVDVRAPLSPKVVKEILG